MESEGTGNRRWQMVRGRRPAGRRSRWRAVLPYLVVAGVLVLAGGLGWLVYGSTVFSARTVQVHGAITISQDEIRAAAAVPRDVPLAQLNADAISDRVAALPAVASARVSRSWPSTVTVVVTERVAVAVTARDGAFVVIDRTGVQFRTVRTRPAGLPLIESAEERSTMAAVTVATALGDKLREKLAKITASTPEQVTLHLRDGRTVFWGGADDSARKNTVATALLSKPGKHIDVSAPDVVTVR